MSWHAYFLPMGHYIYTSGSVAAPVICLSIYSPTIAALIFQAPVIMMICLLSTFQHQELFPAEEFCTQAAGSCLSRKGTVLGLSITILQNALVSDDS